MAPRKLLAALALVAAPLAHADDYPQGLIRERLELAARGVEVDLSKLRAGELAAVEYVGRPVLVYRRTSAEQAYLKKAVDAALADPNGDNMRASIEAAYESSVSLVWPRLFLVDQPGLEKTPGRSKREEFLVVAGWDPASGCRLRLEPPTKKGKTIAAFADTCAKGRFDAAGRRLRQEEKAAAFNLYIPPHRFEGEKLVVGLAPGAAMPEFEFSPARLYLGSDPTHDLIIAARYDDARMVQITLAKGADVNGFRPVEGSPLDAAIIGSRIQIVKLLIQRGAQPTGRSMRAAESIGRREVWEMLEAMARKKGSG